MEKAKHDRRRHTGACLTAAAGGETSGCLHVTPMMEGSGYREKPCVN